MYKRQTEDGIDDNADADGSFLFDEQIVVKKKAAILKKPSVEVKKSVGQFAPQRTLRTSPKIRSAKTQQGMGINTEHVSSPTIHDVHNETFATGLKNMHVGYQPNNIKQARAHVTWPIWKAAMDKEVKGLLSRGTWTEVRRLQVPSNVKIMGSQFIFKDKIT